MPRNDKNVSAEDPRDNSPAAIERDFLEAIERLEENKPTHPKLIKRFKDKPAKINYSTVALEARRSRTLIGTKDSAYPNVRARIEAAMEDVPEEKTARGIIRKARLEKAEKGEQLKLANSFNAALIQRLARLEREVKRRLRTAERMVSATKSNPNQLAGRSLENARGAVVPFPGGRDDE